MRYLEVDPESFIHPEQEEPAHGRGAWNRNGMEWTWRYEYNRGETVLGSECEKSLDHWAVGAGVRAIQYRLSSLGIDHFPVEARGVFNRRTQEAVRTFQGLHKDPKDGKPLEADGTVGTSDARALWTPVIDNAEDSNRIPNHYCRGQIAHESQLDPGALGSLAYDEDDPDNPRPPEDRYNGFDRGLAQINSEALHTIEWVWCFRPWFAINFAAEKLRDSRNALGVKYPDQDPAVLWDAAICSHNSPVRGDLWAKHGEAPTAQAAAYVQGVKDAIY